MEDPIPPPPPPPPPGLLPISDAAARDDEPKKPKNDFFYKYWDKFTTTKKNNSAQYKKANKKKLTSSIDRDEEGLPTHHPEKNKEGVVTSQKATTSYEEAAEACKAKVEAIAAECKRLNVKFYDQTWDLSRNMVDCLMSLNPSEVPSSLQGLSAVASVKRVEDIFEKPQFFIEGIDANDVKQGYIGDCWFLAAISALSGQPKLLEKICVARNEQVGVYGFVFYRDGEWISEVVDDRLCLKRSDDNTKHPTEYMLNVSGNEAISQLDLKDTTKFSISKLPKEFSDSLRKGSKALYFSSCKDNNETWLPLLEKAYAKAHGDYQAIEGGISGEGIEDLTGGVAISLPSEDILDKNRLWNELTRVNKDFLFGCSSRRGRSYEVQDDEGFVRGHAYTVLEAREIRYKGEDIRLLKIRNPWGEQEWNGAWSDGSKEWTADAMTELSHTFGDDGVFWISYKDFLKYYPRLDRTRLFGSEWTINQQWACVEVPWQSDYLDSKFTLEVKKKSQVVLVLSQPDDRYFLGLTGRYDYDLHFRLYKDGEKTYILRSMESSGSGRSCTAEFEMEPGKYHILVKITASRDDETTTFEEVIKDNREDRREKLLTIGKSYDLVHSKGNLREAESGSVEREKKEFKDKIRANNAAGRDKRKRQRERERRRRARTEAEIKRKKAVKKAENIKDEENAVEVISKEEEDKKEEEEAEEKEEGKEEETKPDPEVVIPGPEPVTEEHTEATKEELLDEPTASSRRTSGDSKSTDSAASPRLTPPFSPETATAPSAPGDKPGPKDGEEGKKPATHEEAKEVGEKTHLDKKEIATELREIASQLLYAESEEEEVSDVTDDDFDWDSDIDGDESESDEDDDDEDDDMYSEDPWKAICVIGLRVYHVDAGVEIGFIDKDE